MHKLLLSLLLAAPLMAQQIPLTGSIGVPGSASVLGGITVQMPSDTNYTLTPSQWANKTLVLTSASALTATRNIVAPLNKGQEFNIENDTTGGQSIVIIGATGTGVTIANGATASIFSNGTNYITVTGSGNTSFSTITSGTNTSAAMVVGSGSSIDTSGSGNLTINGTELCRADGTNCLADLGGTPTFTLGAGAGLGATGGFISPYADGIVRFEFRAGSSGSGEGTLFTITFGGAPRYGVCSVSRTDINSTQLITNFQSTPTGFTISLPAGAPPLSGGLDYGWNILCPSSNGSTGGGSTAIPPLPALVAQPTPSSTTFLQALNNAKNAPVNIVVAGDSFTVCEHTNCGAGGGPTIATNRWPEQLRIQLQAIYGSHGTGQVPLVYSASASPAINALAWSCTGTVDTSTNSLGPTQSSGNALVHLHNGAVCTFQDTRNIAWDTLNTYCMTNGTSGSLAINIDGGAATGTACGTVSGSPTAHVATLATTSSSFHSVTFTSTGDSYLYAAEGAAGTSGVSVHLIGVGGAIAAMFGANPTAELAFSDLIPTKTQAFVYMDQTNDAAESVATSTFSTQVQSIITHEQGLSSSPTVMLAIPPVDVVNGTSAMAPYTAVQNSLCTTNSLTCINIQQRGTTVGSTAVGWGTTYIPSSLWDLSGTAWPGGNAGVHPSDPGTLDEAQQIYAQLVNPAGAGGSGGGCSNNCTFTGVTIINGGSTENPLNVTSTNAAGTYFGVEGTAPGVDLWAVQSDAFHDFLIGDFTSTRYALQLNIDSGASGYIAAGSDEFIGWANGFLNPGVSSIDTCLQRASAGAINVGNCTSGNTSGTLNLATLNTGALSGGSSPINVTSSSNLGLQVIGSNSLNEAIGMVNQSTGGLGWAIASTGSSNAGGAGNIAFSWAPIVGGSATDVLRMSTALATFLIPVHATEVHAVNGFSGTCGPAQTLTIVDGIVTGCT